jgi:hypothetical protein
MFRGCTLPSVEPSRVITGSISLNDAKRDDSMDTITTKDGTTIFFRLKKYPRIARIEGAHDDGKVADKNYAVTGKFGPSSHVN